MFWSVFTTRNYEMLVSICLDRIKMHLWCEKCLTAAKSRANLK